MRLGRNFMVSTGRAPDRRGRLGASALLTLALAGLAAGAAARDPVPVKVQPLAQVALHPREEAPATVVSLNESTVAAEVAGRVVEIPVRVGDPVPRAAPLARIDCRDHELERDRVEATLRGTAARLELARYQLGQAESLSRRGNVSEETLAQRRADLAALEAQELEQRVGLAIAGRRVEKCQVRAPFRAVVTARLASEGEWRNPGEPVARLLDLEAIEVSAQVEASDVGDLGEDAALVFSDGRRAYPLTLRAVVPAVDARARTREARLAFAAEAALPGTPGRLVWQAPSPHVPADLLVRRGEALGVFTVEDGRAVFRPLPGALEGRPAAVALPEATPIVLEGRHGLRDGDPVAEAR
jgi:RND family efflux transporter MFP subunit